MNKPLLIQAICEKVENELAVIKEAARAAHTAANDPENKAENQYDTRGLEASYLAEAQAKRVVELEEMLLVYRATKPKDFQPDESVAPTALVEVQSGSKKSSFFILARGGGLSISFEGKSVQTVTPQSPLGEALIGLKKDDIVEVENGNYVREYVILSLC
ncbi:MAG: GreA/GreB family elongation factor [Xanthomonadaceae bacterium]|nr:GreA/GreB family elongation factor [Xanthomonadaceae bacterium]